jgi:hypothetical protein
MPRVPDVERRARLVARHHLARTAADVTEAARAVVASHCSDPATPYLGAWARVPGFETADLDRALYEERTLWRLHAMRRTLFVVPTDGAGTLHAAAASDIARKERRRLEEWLAAEMDPATVPSWLAAVEARTLEALGDGREWRTQDLTVAVEELGTQLTVGSGRWTVRAPLSSRVLFLMAMEGRVVRARPAGTWRSSQYRWVAAAAWFDRRLARADPDEARADLASSYLAAHGPATIVDLRWWTGWTVRHATAALRAIGAEKVELDSGGDGYVLPGDLDSPDPAGPHVTLLPGLDSTPMGWKERGWFLAEAHVGTLFDRNGNVGPTVWVDGRIVGGWAQRPDGKVVHRLLATVGARAQRRVDLEAAALTEWLDGVAVTPRFRTPLERELSA